MSESPESNNRLYPQSPIACVAAVVFKEGKILLIKRAKEPNKGKWSIPGGGIELGETISEAARREVFEECSVEIEIERVLDSADNIVRDEKGRIKYHYVIIDLLARYTGGDIKAQSDAEECGWFKPEGLAGLDMSLTLRAMLERQRIIKT
jgi:ADP-ribose pyrophosphatase YjhB (NUDIX family)